MLAFVLGGGTALGGYRGLHDAALKGSDFSQSSLDRRWLQGRAGMDAAVRLWRSQPPAASGLAAHDLAVHDLAPEPAHA